MIRINYIKPEEGDIRAEFLDGQVDNISYIKKKTFDKAVDDNKLSYNVIGKTTLKKIKPEDEKKYEDAKVLRCFETDLYEISKCKFTRVIGYIPVEDGKFVEYRKFNFMALLLFLFGIFACLIALIYITHKPTPEKESDVKIGYEVGQTKNKRETDEEEKQTELPAIVFPGFTELRIKAGVTTVDTISLFNPPQNEDWYDLSFTISADLNDDGEMETIYESGKVAPGYRINEVELSEGLKAGTYDAKVSIHAYYVNDDTLPLNDGAIEVPLIVE